MKILKYIIRQLFEFSDWLRDWSDDRLVMFCTCEICEVNHIIFLYSDKFKPHCPNCHQDGLIEKHEGEIDKPMVSYFDRDNNFEGYED